MAEIACPYFPNRGEPLKYYLRSRRGGFAAKCSDKLDDLPMVVLGGNVVFCCIAKWKWPSRQYTMQPERPKPV
jgi:hypothetical protein